MNKSVFLGTIACMAYGAILLLAIQQGLFGQALLAHPNETVIDGAARLCGIVIAFAGPAFLLSFLTRKVKLRSKNG